MHWWDQSLLDLAVRLPQTFWAWKKQGFFKNLFRVSNASKILIYIGLNSKRVDLLAHIFIFFNFIFFLIENGDADSHPGWAWGGWGRSPQLMLYVKKTQTNKENKMENKIKLQSKLKTSKKTVYNLKVKDGTSLCVIRHPRFFKGLTAQTHHQFFNLACPRFVWV